MELSLKQTYNSLVKRDFSQVEEMKKLAASLRKGIATRRSNLAEDYWEETTDTLYNKLLQAEINLLAHPANFWQMAMPLGDDILKGEIKNHIEAKVNNWKEDPKNRHIYWITEEKSNYSDIMTVKLNSIKTILYLQGKAGVGMFALQGVSHAISGTHPFILNDSYTIENPFDLSSEKALTESPNILTELPILLDKKLLNSNMSSLTTLDGNLISEIISQLLTSQVDIGKNPYPAMLGLVLENLITISYGIRRGIPLEVMMELVLNPVVQEFRQTRGREESLFSKASGGDIGKNKIITNFIKKSGRFSSIPVSLYQENKTHYININKSSDGLYEISKDNNDLNIFMSYLYISEQAREYNKYIKVTKFDNTTFKGKEQSDVWREELDKLMYPKTSQLFTSKSLQDITANSITSPFAKTKIEGYGMFDDLYLDSHIKGHIKYLQSLFTSNRDMEDVRERTRSKVESAFITYLIQSKMTEFLKGKTNKEYVISESNLKKCN